MLVHQLLVEVAYLRFKVRQEGCLADEVPDFLAGRGEGGYVIGVQA
ncbi:hypothetical protein QFZ36_002285 [Pseudarthrobacter siccitolerans]|uniref:Uncharacterized protein n=1 Tax=Pseudarthrobacter siccitolerans TaxID=861266 RepID=A0ABU0PL79_9MICC|nr:hypothetical protein [Pseudarthrobacter siccitolerans]